jgi:threonine dehydratase
MLSIEEIEAAARLIEKKILQTPLVHSQSLSQRFGAEIYFKLENLQKTGSFKIRGALYKLLKNRGHLPPAGVVAASAGNHAQGIALAAREVGVPATIVMPRWASITKQEATRSYGGQVVIYGDSVEESLEKAHEFAREGRLFIHPFDDWDIMAGQASVALEIFKELDGIDTLLVPIGGGGLIAGVVAVAHATHPDTAVIGVQTAASPAAAMAFERGHVVKVDAQPSLADGINVKQLGEKTFRVMRRHVDRVVLVDEEQVAAAMLLLLERRKVLAEGAGASPLAALLSGEIQLQKGSRAVLVVSGGNVDSPLLDRILNKGLLKNGRVMRLSVMLKDVPGSLARLLAQVAALEANVLHIVHDRRVRGMPIHMSFVELELETRNHEHIGKVIRELHAAGYDAKVG